MQAIRKYEVRIKDQYKLLKPENSQATLVFQQSQPLNHDTYLSRFLLKDKDKVLGHQIGQYVELSYRDQNKSYVPISRIDDAGFVDFAIRKLPSQPDKPSASQTFISMGKGTEITVRGPLGKTVYEGYGNFRSADKVNNYRYVGLLAQGTALSSFFSMIQAVATSNDTTCLSLLWSNQKKQDFFLLQQLNWFVQQQKLNLNIMIEEPDKNWLGPIGSLTSRHISNFMPPPSDKTVILVAGSKNFFELSQNLCSSLNYKSIIRFT